MSNELTIRFSMRYNPGAREIEREMAAVSQVAGHEVSFDKCKRIPATQDSYIRQETDWEYCPSE